MCEIYGRVLICLPDKHLEINNTLLDFTKNYLRDSLCESGSFNPIKKLVYYYGNTRGTVSVSYSIVSKSIYFETTLDKNIGPVTISAFSLINNSGVDYAKIDVPNFIKTQGTEVSITWILTIL